MKTVFVMLAIGVSATLLMMRLIAGYLNPGSVSKQVVAPPPTRIQIYEVGTISAFTTYYVLQDSETSEEYLLIEKPNSVSIVGIRKPELKLIEGEERK